MIELMLGSITQDGRMKELLIVLSEKEVKALGAVRCYPGLKVAVNGDEVWLRGILEIENPDIKIRQLPARKTYILDEGGYLFLPGSLTPVDVVKELEWQPIADFIKPELPTSAMPGILEQPFSFQLVASDQADKGEALLTTLDLWKAYAEDAPEARLRKLRFAVSENKQVLLLGTPLPPIPGKEYWLKHQNLLPAGYDFDIPLISELLAAKINPLQDAILLFDMNSNCEKIPLESFAWASRSAVRLTE